MDQNSASPCWTDQISMQACMAGFTLDVRIYLASSLTENILHVFYISIILFVLNLS